MNRSKNLLAISRLKIFVALAVTIAFSTIALYWVVPVQAAVWCHDYTLYRVTCGMGACVDENKIGVEAFQERLTALKYEIYPIADAATNPESAHKDLKPGDVIILRADHSGYVNAKGLIDHYIQIPTGQPGSVLIVRAAGSLPKNEDQPFDRHGRQVGGLFNDHTLEKFLGTPSYKGPMGDVEVWRKKDTKKFAWQRVGTGDCSGRDVGSSDGSVPDDNQAKEGHTAVCWDNGTYKNSGRVFCTYKKIGPEQCKGGGNTGVMYSAVSQ